MWQYTFYRTIDVRMMHLASREVGLCLQTTSRNTGDVTPLLAMMVEARGAPSCVVRFTE